MRRFAFFVVFLLSSVPVGLSIVGCKAKVLTVYCDGGDSGLIVGDLANITMGPQTYGISLNYGESGQVGSPSGTDCKGNTASAPGGYLYGSTNPNIVDVSNFGALCAGTWNRNSPNGVADYTTCTPPSSTALAALALYEQANPGKPAAYITASSGGVVSNPVSIYVHPVVAQILLNPLPTGCVSQGHEMVDGSGNPLPITANAYDASGNNITSLIGHISFNPQSTNILSIDPNGYVTAEAPGSTIITAGVSNAASNAVLFSTCPPQTITISVPNSSTPSILTLTPNLPIALTATVTDQNGVNITGLSLLWETTNPRSIAVSGGEATATYPGSAAITAVCQPPTCNPAPLAYLGVNNNGNGKPIMSNAIAASSSGSNSTVIYMASTQSRYYNTMDFTTGLIGTPALLPYVPNSLVISQDGSSLYMGNTQELMVMSSAGALIKQDPTAPGTVLAVSPDGTTLIISDYVRSLIYIYTVSTNSYISFGGTVIAAKFTPDSQTVYMVGGNAQGTPNNKFYAYSTYSGFHDLSSSVAANGANDVTVTVPSVGAYVGGTIATAGYSYCSVGSGSSASYFPQSSGPIVPARIDRITATNNGLHILGATVTPTATLDDVDVSLPAQGTNPQYCPYNNTAPAFGNTLVNQVALGVPAAAITGVTPATNSSVAFVTYTSTATSAKLPAYKPAASGAGTLSSVTLSGAAAAPVAGAFSNDDTTFYVGTAGDNLVHIVNVLTLTDTGTINPLLANVSGSGYATPNLVVSRPRNLN